MNQSPSKSHRGLPIMNAHSPPLIMLAILAASHLWWASANDIEVLGAEGEIQGSEHRSDSEPVIDVDQALRILEETGAMLDRIIEIRAETGGRATDESDRLFMMVSKELNRLDLEALDLPDGTLLSEESLIEAAIRYLLHAAPQLTRDDIVDLPPVVEWTSGRARVTFPIRQPEDRKAGFGPPAYRFQLILHPTTVGVLMVLRRGRWQHPEDR